MHVRLKRKLGTRRVALARVAARDLAVDRLASGQRLRLAKPSAREARILLERALAVLVLLSARRHQSDLERASYGVPTTRPRARARAVNQLVPSLSIRAQELQHLRAIPKHAGAIIERSPIPKHVRAIIERSPIPKHAGAIIERSPIPKHVGAIIERSRARSLSTRAPFSRPFSRPSS